MRVKLVVSNAVQSRAGSHSTETVRKRGSEPATEGAALDSVTRSAGKVFRLGLVRG
jgi:hypothetical protein